MRGREFSELSAFVAIAEQGNFTRAAVQLGIATPTLSQSIRQFEERLGVRLLNRTTRSVSLTDAGERLLAEAQPMLDGISRAIQRVNEFRDKPVGNLRLSVARPAAVALISPLLPRFLSAFPQVKLEVCADETPSDIVSGRFDAGIRLGERIAKDMIAVRLIDEFRTVVVASLSYLAARSWPKVPKDLSGHNCVRLRSDWDGAIQPWLLEKRGRRVELTVDGTIVLNDMYLVTRAVLDGIGVGYLPEPLIAPVLESDTVSE